MIAVRLQKIVQIFDLRLNKRGRVLIFSATIFLLSQLTLAEGELCDENGGILSQITNIQHVASQSLDCFESSGITKGGGSPEQQIDAMMKDISEREIAIRLIIAETLASGCPHPDISKGIARVLKNRSDSSKYPRGRDVVFQKYQFRSSTGGCDVAQREVFLCPSRAGRQWQQLWTDAAVAYDEAQTSGGENPLSGVYNYFFFRHFDESKNCSKWKGVVPNWATPAKSATAAEYAFDRECVGFFKP